MKTSDGTVLCGTIGSKYRDEHNFEKKKPVFFGYSELHNGKIKKYICKDCGALCFERDY